MKLNKKQLAVIDDLFAGELDEQAVLDKHKLSRNIYGKWLADEQFNAELSHRIAAARLAGELLIARYSLTAAAKLVQLTESDKEETARRACLDILSLPDCRGQRAALADIDQTEVSEPATPLSPQTVQRLLAVLAEE